MRLLVSSRPTNVCGYLFLDSFFYTSVHAGSQFLFLIVWTFFYEIKTLNPSCTDKNLRVHHLGVLVCASLFSEPRTHCLSVLRLNLTHIKKNELDYVYVPHSD